MRRLPLLAWVFAVVIAVFLLYRVKYEVQALKSQVEEASRQLEAEKEALHVVAAEWAYLNRPARLRSLAEKYLSSSGMTADRVAEIEAVPFPKTTQAAASAPPPLATPAGFRPDEGDAP